MMTSNHMAVAVLWYSFIHQAPGSQPEYTANANLTNDWEPGVSELTAGTTLLLAVWFQGNVRVHISGSEHARRPGV